jgi:hypothetical protein
MDLAQQAFLVSEKSKAVATQMHLRYYKG